MHQLTIDQAMTKLQQQEAQLAGLKAAHQAAMLENAKLRELLAHVIQAANANNIRPEVEAKYPLWMDATTLREIAEVLE